MSRTFRLGLFLVGTLSILAVGVFLIGRHDLMFSSKYRLKAEFQNVAGLGGGATVRVGGIHQGTVARIELPTRPDGKVVVIMELASPTREIIKKDSVASIKTEGLLGSKYVEVSFGSNEAEKVKDGDTILSEPPLDFADLIRKSNEILDTTRSAVQNVDNATGHLRSISTKINQGQGTVGALINDKAIYEQAKATTAEAKAGATAFRENMQALKQNFFLRGFFRRRGYDDADKLTKHAIAQFPEQPKMQSFIYPAKQIFEEPDGAKLRNQKVLHAAGKFLEQNQFGLAVVAASTGMKGDTEKNRVLTQARSMVVRDYLAQNFKLDDTRIKTIGLGKRPETDESRVEIVIYPAGVNPPANGASSGS